MFNCSSNTVGSSNHYYNLITASKTSSEETSINKTKEDNRIDM